MVASSRIIYLPKSNIYHMIRNILLGLLISLTLFNISSCSSDDDNNNNEQAIPSFIVIGKKDNDNAFQYDYNRESQSGELINLGEQQIPANYNSVDFKEDVLCFVAPQSTSFKNIRTNEITTVDLIFNNSNGELAFSHTYSSSHIFSAYQKMVGSNDMYIRSKNIFDASEVDIPIGKADLVNGLLYSQNRLVVAYLVRENLQTLYYVTVLNTIDNSIVKTLEFDAGVKFITTDTSGNLMLGSFSSSSTSSELKVYKLNSMELSAEYTSSSFFTGISNGLFQNNNLFYLQPFPQPSAIPFLPSVYNIETNVTNTIDILPALFNYAMNDDDIDNISLINSIVNFENNTLLVSTNFTQINGNNLINKVGVFLFDFNGNILSDIVIDEDFRPLHIYLK